MQAQRKADRNVLTRRELIFSVCARNTSSEIWYCRGRVSLCRISRWGVGCYLLFVCSKDFSCFEGGHFALPSIFESDQSRGAPCLLGFDKVPKSTAVSKPIGVELNWTKGFKVKPTNTRSSCMIILIIGHKHCGQPGKGGLFCGVIIMVFVLS